MRSISRHTGVLSIVGRLDNSKHGNPRYKAVVDGWAFVTAPDSSYGYEIPNHASKTVTVTLGTHYGRLTLNSIERIEI